MCDGQYRLMQNYLREQKDNILTINLVGEVALFAQVCVCVCVCLHSHSGMGRYTGKYMFTSPLPTSTSTMTLTGKPWS